MTTAGSRLRPTLQLPPLAVYVHIPWCVKKCPYCDFNSHHAAPELPEAAYVQCLIQDLDADLHWAQGRRIDSIFFGGGTPSLFSAEAIGRILEALNQHIGFSDGVEITLEANPGTADQAHFVGYRQAGVNRLSVGVQSFDADQLQRLGRIHSHGQIFTALDMARQAGFDNINLDLMFGLPEQNQAEALADLQQAIALEPNHLSWYQLTLEPNTVFYNQPPPLPDDDTIADLHQAGQALLEQAGFSQYEISAYAQPGAPCRHNLNYWQFGDYLGLGAGAHGKITQADTQSIIRTRKTRQPDHYLNRIGHYRAAETPIAVDDLALEFMLNALRLNEGVDESLFTERTGLTLDSIAAPLTEARRLGLMHEHRIQPTAAGLRYLNDLLALFAG